MPARSATPLPDHPDKHSTFGDTHFRSENECPQNSSVGDRQAGPLAERRDEGRGERDEGRGGAFGDTHFFGNGCPQKLPRQSAERKAQGEEMRDEIRRTRNEGRDEL